MSTIFRSPKILNFDLYNWLLCVFSDTTIYKRHLSIFMMHRFLVFILCPFTPFILEFFLQNWTSGVCSGHLIGSWTFTICFLAFLHFIKEHHPVMVRPWVRLDVKFVQHLPAVFFHGREEIGRLAKQIKKIIKRTLQGKNKNHDIISWSCQRKITNNIREN